MKYFSNSDKITANGLNAGGEEPNENEVKFCEIWIKTYLIKTKSINKNIGSSYHLKHIVESFGQVLYHYKIKLNGIEYITYVSNGAFIEAMKNCGYQYSDRESELNPHFNAKYNGPFIIENYLKSIPNNSFDWEKLLSSLLSNIATQENFDKNIGD